MKSDTFSIIQMLALYAPILIQANAWLSLPIALVVKDTSVARHIQRGLSYDHSEITIEATVSSGKLERKLGTVGSCPGFLYFRNTQASVRTLEMLIDSVSAGSINGTKVNGAVFVVFQDVIPPCYTGCFLEIYFDDNDISFCPLDELLLPEDMLPGILRKMAEDHCSQNDSGMLGCLHYLLPESVGEENEKAFDEKVRALMAANDGGRDEAGIMEAVLLKLYAWVQEKKVEIWALPILSDEAIKRLESDMFIRGNDLFIAERTFAKAIESLTETVPIGVIKNALYEEGTLRKTAENRYVFRMCYSDSAGNPHNKRMMKLSADHVKLTGKPTIIELCGGIKK